MDKTEEKESWVLIVMIIVIPIILTGITYFFSETLIKFVRDNSEWMVFGVFVLFCLLNILKSGDGIHTLISFLPVFIFIGGMLFIIHMMTLQAEAETQKSEQEYQQYGCYPITREYQECGPVEGKPGFTKCTTKTERVCPETK